METTLVWLCLGIILGATVTKLYPILKDGKITEDEKEEFKDIIVNAIKNVLVLSNTKSKAELKVLAVDNINTALLNKNINGFTEEEINNAVDLVLNGIEKTKSVEFDK